MSGSVVPERVHWRIGDTGGLVTFMRVQLGKPIPSPVVLGQVSEKFREAVKAQAERQQIPVHQFQHKERKDDIANDFRRKRGVRDQIVFIGVAQEKAKAFSGTKVNGHSTDMSGPGGNSTGAACNTKREFFEEIIRDNLDLGRPDRVQLIFDRVVTRKTPGEFRTRVIQDGVHPSLHINYKNFDLKHYFKEGRGCRTEGTFRNPNDFGVNKGLSNLPYLQKLGRQIKIGVCWKSNAPATTAA